MRVWGTQMLNNSLGNEVILKKKDVTQYFSENGDLQKQKEETRTIFSQFF